MNIVGVNGLPKVYLATLMFKNTINSTSIPIWRKSVQKITGYINGHSPREIAVVIIYVTPRKTRFFVFALFRVENAVKVKGGGCTHSANKYV